MERTTQENKEKASLDMFNAEESWANKIRIERFLKPVVPNHVFVICLTNLCTKVYIFAMIHTLLNIPTAWDSKAELSREKETRHGILGPVVRLWWAQFRFIRQLVITRVHGYYVKKKLHVKWVLRYKKQIRYKCQIKDTEIRIWRDTLLQNAK